MLIEFKNSVELFLEVRMKCCICNKKLSSFKDCKEIWYNGGRIPICKNDDCYKRFVQIMRDSKNKKH